MRLLLKYQAYKRRKAFLAFKFERLTTRCWKGLRRDD
jgi:hypothetical protein